MGATKTKGHNIELEQAYIRVFRCSSGQLTGALASKVHDVYWLLQSHHSCHRTCIYLSPRAQHMKINAKSYTLHLSSYLAHDEDHSLTD